MKDIHVLPTDKPTGIFKSGDNLLFSITDKVRTTNEGFYIYITSDEEIKEGDWYYNYKTNTIQRRTEGTNNESYIGFKKIILTTDQDLIKDGVQAIDDEFLEWFVKNPSCESVDVESNYRVKSGTIQEHNEGKAGYEYYEYKIIIPKEEPKQETLEEAEQKTPDEYLQVCKYCSSEEVARCKWVNVNTEEIYSADSGTNLEWCFDCKSETNIIDKKDYETKI
jgi:hypothetical protein